MESLFAELAAEDVLRPLPHVELADYLGAPSYMGSTLERAGMQPDVSMAQVWCLPCARACALARAPATAMQAPCPLQTAVSSINGPARAQLPLLARRATRPLLPCQVRQIVTEYAILPLGSAAAHARLPHVRSLLLYGAHRTGKTMLAQARWRLWQGWAQFWRRPPQPQPRLSPLRPAWLPR